MKKLLTLLFLLCASLLAFDTMEVLNPNITIHKSGFFKTDKVLTPEEAFAFAKTNNLKELSKQAMCSGFDNNTYWFLFEASINADEPIYLNPRGTSIFHQDLFVFKDEKLIKSYKNGFFVPIEQRDIKIFPVRFKLEQNSKNITYLLKLESTTPKYLSVSFGTIYELNKSWIATYIVIVSVSAIAISFILYNLFIFFYTKDIAYFYYCFYMVGLLFANYVSFGHQLLFLGIDGRYVDKLMPFAAIICILGLTFFTIHFLDIRQKYKRFKQVLIALNIALVVLAPLYVSGIAKPLFLGVVQVISLLTIAIGVKRYFDGYKPASYYLIATGVAMIMTTVWSVMLSGKIVPLTFLSAHLGNFAIIWDAILLSLALAYRIKILQQEHDIAQRMVEARSRFAALGETIGSIAHQWRQPLNELSSINTHIDAQIRFNGGVDKEELQKSLKESDDVIKRLSSIIDTFYGFFEQSRESGDFEPTSVIRDVIDFMGAQFEANNITIDFDDSVHCKLTGNSEEFFQAVLNILSNAKDALVENGAEKPKISIKVSATETKVAVTIVDNGGGIKYKDANQIFEPYVSTKSLQGMGLGLFITKTIIEKRMNGSIIAENTKEGARFVIVFGL